MIPGLERYLYASGRDWTIYNADALAILPHIPAESIDAIVTDPPYSSGGQYKSDRSRSTRDKYVNSDAAHEGRSFTGDSRDQRSHLAWCALWLSQCLDAAVPGAIVSVFTDWRQLPVTTDAIQAAGWTWRGINSWDKKNARPYLGRFTPQCEYVVWGTNGARGPTGSTAPGAFLHHPPKQNEREHITQKPVEVIEWLLRPLADGGTVLDPFIGSGTAGVACLRRGFRFIGIDKDAGYCEIARRRLEAADQARALFEQEAGA